jgi:hypothetical protein
LLRSCSTTGIDPFSADSIAYEKHEQINGFIVAEVDAHQADLVCKGLQKSFCGEVLGEESVIARTIEELRDVQEERFELLCTAWISYQERPLISRVGCVSLS